jgi:hypothetical protein
LPLSLGNLFRLAKQYRKVRFATRQIEEGSRALAPLLWFILSRLLTCDK